VISADLGLGRQDLGPGAQLRLGDLTGAFGLPGDRQVQASSPGCGASTRDTRGSLSRFPVLDAYRPVMLTKMILGTRLARVRARAVLGV